MTPHIYVSFGAYYSTDMTSRLHNYILYNNESPEYADIKLLLLNYIKIKDVLHNYYKQPEGPM